MCGFLGEFNFSNSNKISIDSFNDLLKLSNHRGPDSSFVISKDRFRLGFNRLSILDLSNRGNQPMVSPSGRYSMVFNGEIYNFKILKEKYNLKKLNSNTDSEVIIHLIDLIGLDKTVRQLDGMFAIMIVDAEIDQTFLIRDFAGIKPLFYGINDKGLVAASQFDQIYKHDWFKSELTFNESIVKEYFGLGFMMAPNTIYKKIYQVKPGEIVKINNIGKITRESYLTFYNRVKINNECSDVTINAFISKLSDVVKKQLVSDVPIGVFLSGGIDSPLITGMAVKYKKDIKAYTIGVNDSKMDESEKAKDYAKSLSVEHVLKEVDELNLLKSINKHFEYFPEPFGDYSSIPTYIATKESRKINKVMLSGDGADELFFGYPKLLHILLYSKLFYKPFFIRKNVSRFLFRLNLINTRAPIDHEYLSDWILRKQLYINKKTLNKFIKNIPFSQETLEYFKLNKKTKNNKQSIFSFLKENEFYTHMQRVLIKVDRASMGNSLEVRVPFLSKEIIEFAFGLYSNKLNREYVLKGVLKKSLSLFIPEILLYKKKKGFTVPMKKWLRNELKPDLEKMIFETEFYGSELIDDQEIKIFVRGFIEGRHDNEWGVWHIYAWQKWAYTHVLKI
jgi:asparagine synthase (glutamine-hydrolysing)